MEPLERDITKREINHNPYVFTWNSGANKIGVTTKKSHENPKNAPGENHEPVAFLANKDEKKIAVIGRIFKILI
tara:strand:+ start:344 stop:565 length:222 start_codon:yes stop_codon:yes gene_type:complete